MASSSVAIDVCCDYDVFLSFRGQDTRNNFTSHLYEDLCRTGIKVFIDNKIDRGEEITTTIERVIESVKLSVIVFSADYGSSTFCLDELVKIIECRESKDQIVLPIFYKMKPSEDAYRQAFAKHKAEFKSKKRLREETIKQQRKKLRRWKSAFCKAINLGGWHIDDKSVEAELVKKITREVLKRLNCEPLRQPKGEELMWTSIVGQTAEDIFKNIWNCLMDNDISRVGIYGMGGVGKTTIATRVNDELLARANSFTHVFWVTVSKDLSIWKLQNKIAKKINLDLSKEDEKLMRAAKLRKRLRTEKFVLILDDIWEAFEIEDMGIPRLVGAQKLLLTTRDRRVCKGMNCQPIKVDPLSQQESLDLFMEEYGNEIKDSVTWKGIVYSIVGECAGLPLAIVVIARRMREMGEFSEWRNVLRKLKEPCKGENHGMEEQIFKPLKLSYDNLPDYQYQQCFLYCSLFPEDHEQRRDSLIEYLIGEGLLGELDSRQAELDLGNAIINGLINASLLLEVTNRFGVYIKMHDVVKDMAEIVIRENIRAQEGLKLQDLSKETKRCFNLNSVFIMNFSVFESDVPNLPPNASKLTTLSFNELYVRELPFHFFANMQNLVVLDMSVMVGLMSVPNSISFLKNLRVLLLHTCDLLEYVPSLAELKKLRYLDFSYTSLKEIPKGMERLINLRVLKMSSVGSWDAFFPGAFLEKLSHLQVLVIENVEVEAEAVISLKKLETLRIVFYNLESLNTYFKSGHWKRLEEYFIFYLLGEKRSVFEMWEEENEPKKALLMGKLGDIGGGKGETDMTLPNNIQFLQFRFWNGPMVDIVKNSTFHNLRKLVIGACEDRQRLFTPALVQRVLLNVEELNICHGNDVEEIISGEEELVGEINNYYYPTIHLPKLKYLSLIDLTNLKSINKGTMVCPSLQRIRIEGCGKIERLPFCMKERNNLNPIQLQLRCMPNKWWDSLHWYDPHAKSFYQVQVEDPLTSEDDDPTEEDYDQTKLYEEAIDLTWNL